MAGDVLGAEGSPTHRRMSGSISPKRFLYGEVSGEEDSQVAQHHVVERTVLAVVSVVLLETREGP